MLSNILSAATSTDVEQVFSQGWILLSHVHNQLSIQSIRALMCLGVWSKLGYVENADVQAVMIQPEVDSEEEELPIDWEVLV